MAKVVYTKQCRDGRACAGSIGYPAFIRDEYDVCDSCLEQIYDLTPVYDTCGCGHYSEQNGFETKDVLALVRGERRPLRYYVQQRLEYRDETGEVVTKRFAVHTFLVYYEVFDSEDPWPRKPIYSFGGGKVGDFRAQDAANKRAKEMNEAL